LNITIAEQDLTQIENNIFDANIQSNETRIKVYDFRERVKALQEKFAHNQINVYRSEEEAEDAENLAQTAEQDAAELETKYADLKRKLEAKFNQTRYAKEKASTLKTKATDMYNSIYSKVQSLTEWDRRFSEQEGKLINIQRLILEHNDIMTELVVSIKSSERYLRTCGTA
jgi:predicted  nucleic acid-binding Zn-ribbon protein